MQKDTGAELSREFAEQVLRINGVLKLKGIKSIESALLYKRIVKPRDLRMGLPERDPPPHNYGRTLTDDVLNVPKKMFPVEFHLDIKLMPEFYPEDEDLPSRHQPLRKKLALLHILCYQTTDCYSHDRSVYKELGFRNTLSPPSMILLSDGTMRDGLYVPGADYPGYFEGEYFTSILEYFHSFHLSDNRTSRMRGVSFSPRKVSSLWPQRWCKSKANPEKKINFSGNQEQKGRIIEQIVSQLEQNIASS